MNLGENLFLSLGSNQGDSLAFLQKAVEELHQYLGNIKHISSVYRTQSWGFEADDFLNIAIEIHTRYTPSEVVEIIKTIEKKLGRVYQSDHTYQSRTIDIDIIFFGNQI